MMRKGFTIVEFLIFIAIVAILGSLMVPVLIHLNRDEAKFSEGQTVTVKQTGEEVMILSRVNGYWNPYRYSCRTVGPTQRRREGVIFEDTDITRYQIVEFREFELQGIKRRRSR